MRNLLMALVVLLISPARAEMIKIPWNGDYPHNGETVWSTENKYHKSGLTRNFMNGAPEEHKSFNAMASCKPRYFHRSSIARCLSSF